MKKSNLITRRVLFPALVAFSVATPSFAAPTELDKKTVASKAYVDTKQDIIPAGTTGDIVLYNGTSNGQTQFTGRKITTTLDSNNTYNIPTQGAVTAGLSYKEDVASKVTQDQMSNEILPIIWDQAGYGEERFQWLWSTFGFDHGLPTDGGTAFLLPMLAYDYNVGKAVNFMDDKSTYPSMNTMLNAMGGMLKLHANPDDINSAMGAYDGLEAFLVDVGLVYGHEIQDFASVGGLYLDGNNNPVVPFVNDYGGHFVPTLKTMLVALGQMTTNLNGNFQPIIRAVSLDTQTNDPITAPVVNYPSSGNGNITPRLVLGYSGGNYSLKAGDKIGGWMEGADFTSTGAAGTSNLTEIEAQNALPTLKYLRDDMWPQINAKQDKLNAKSSNARAQAVTRDSSSGDTLSAYITAGGAVGLTTRSGAPAVINYVNGTATDFATFTTGTFGTNNSTNQNYIKNALVSLELLKDVYSALHTEIQNARPTGTPGNVAMYDATTGVLSDGVATYDGSTTYNASTDATKIPTMTGVQRKKECGGYEPAPAGQPAHDGTHPGDEDYCWLWIFPD